MWLRRAPTGAVLSAAIDWRVVNSAGPDMVVAASDLLQTAFEHHRSGDLSRAEAACRETLRVDPRHADALHLLGVIAFQKREHITAVDRIGQAIDADPGRPELHNSLGNVYRALGCPVEALDAFRQAIRLNPDFSLAYHNLGVTLAEQGQASGAAACFERAVQLDPKNSPAWMNLGYALLERGELEDAAECFECLLEIDADNAAALGQLGHCRSRGGRTADAIAAYERGLERGNDSDDLLKELAHCYLQMGRSADAEGIYRRAVERSPRDANLLLNFAQSLKDQRKFEEAVQWYRRGLALDPQNAEAHYALARALHLSERFEEAIARYRKSISLGSKDAKALYHLGNALKSIKRLNEAVEAYLETLDRDPDFLPALYQLGNAYRQLFDLDSAKRCYEKVLAQKPGDLIVSVALGNVLKEQDDLVGAAAAYRRVLRHVTDQPLWELWLATLCPTVFHSTVGIDQYRGSLLTRLQDFATKKVVVTPEAIAGQGCPPPYNLQFHGRDNRPLKEAYARIFADALSEPGFDRWWLRAGKPRVGFVVSDGHEGVFLRYLRGVLERIDRKNFDPVVICSAGGRQRLLTQVPADAFETFVIPSRFDQVVERVRKGRFAVLYHWEIGSDVTNYFLPFFRLAPVQCTGAGLPDTSGIPQVDYFLTSAACEPGRAERNYSERLIVSPSLLTWQARLNLTASAPSGDLGFSKSERVYLCPHKIEKFHPDFDGLLGDILRRDPQGTLVIPRDRHGYTARKLENRLRMGLPHVAERIRFVPYQSVEGYFGLIEAADVLLDPLYYGGGLTSFDGLSLNKPIVTLPGNFVRGRFTYGFYRTMGVDDCIADSPDDYVARAVRLGTDVEWRRHVVERIQQTSIALFDSQAVVTDYDRILGQLVEEAVRRG
ncbi:MAG TPA: tetratricopeptide repeat protein [Planctomycetaceae bacterium]|nr:tetratricopeptide repeat protein [Planctomycetaceae bacterium]